MSVWKMIGNSLLAILKEVGELAQENQNRRQATRMRLNQQDDRKLAEMVRDDGWFSPS